MKQAALLLPIRARGDWSQVPFVDSGSGWQEKNGFLDVRRQIHQLHDLRHARPRHFAAASCISIILNPALPDQSLQPDCQRQEPGDARYRRA